MSEKKYLADGRKVVIVGVLNQNESIVQEIFVTADGDEVPSGERFVAKSLHDSPVVSHKDKRLAQLEKRIKESEAEWQALKNKKGETERQLGLLRTVLKSSKRFVETFDEADLERLSLVMSGNAKWVVYDRGIVERPVPIFDALEYTDGWSRDSRIKLISLLGNSNGDLSFRLHLYPDGSGRGGDEVYFFGTEAEAVGAVAEIAERRLIDQKLSLKEYQLCRELGIRFSVGQVATLKRYLEEGFRASEERREAKRAEEIERDRAAMREIQEIGGAPG